MKTASKLTIKKHVDANTLRKRDVIILVMFFGNCYGFLRHDVLNCSYKRYINAYADKQIHNELGIGLLLLVEINT